jgi:adenylate kinase family enzyme
MTGVQEQAVPDHLRFSVIGTSGSGKTTLGRALAARLQIPHVELDSIFHQANWVPLSDAEFRARVAALVDGECWVIDGNYAVVRDLVWDRATTVVWLWPSRLRSHPSLPAPRGRASR